MAAEGALVVFGGLNIQAFHMGVPELLSLIFKNQVLKGFALVPLLTPDTLRADLDELADMSLRRQLTVAIGGHYPLADAAKAHRDMAVRSLAGKWILMV